VEKSRASASTAKLDHNKDIFSSGNLFLPVHHSFQLNNVEARHCHDTGS
jgi:hypothetical protein